MNTIAIDSNIYHGAEMYAKIHNLSINAVIEQGLLLLFDKIQPKQHVEGETQVSSSKSWVDAFAGKWQDERSTSQIIQELHESRSSNSEIAL
jgi:hypothetical protein